MSLLLYDENINTVKEKDTFWWYIQLKMFDGGAAAIKSQTKQFNSSIISDESHLRTLSPQNSLELFLANIRLTELSQANAMLVLFSL